MCYLLCKNTTEHAQCNWTLCLGPLSICTRCSDLLSMLSDPNVKNTKCTNLCRCKVLLCNCTHLFPMPFSESRVKQGGYQRQVFFKILNTTFHLHIKI